MTKRRMKPKRAATIARMAAVKRLLRNCMNCGQPGGGHFVPPCLGEPGFFICGVVQCQDTPTAEEART